MGRGGEEPSYNRLRFSDLDARGFAFVDRYGTKLVDIKFFR